MEKTRKYCLGRDLGKPIIVSLATRIRKTAPLLEPRYVLSTATAAGLPRFRSFPLQPPLHPAARRLLPVLSVFKSYQWSVCSSDKF